MPPEHRSTTLRDERLVKNAREFGEGDIGTGLVGFLLMARAIRSTDPPLYDAVCDAFVEGALERTFPALPTREETSVFSQFAADTDEAVAQFRSFLDTLVTMKEGEIKGEYRNAHQGPKRSGKLF